MRGILVFCLCETPVCLEHDRDSVLPPVEDSMDRGCMKWGKRNANEEMIASLVGPNQVVWRLMVSASLVAKYLLWFYTNYL